MTATSARHRLLNLVQSALLLGLDLSRFGAAPLIT